MLCGVESQDGGVYECGVDGGSNVTFTVNVHSECVCFAMASYS